MTILKTFIVIISFMFLFSSCEERTKKIDDNRTMDIEDNSNKKNDSSETKYKIVKIDSISDVYLIYASKKWHSNTYKIISKKSDSIDSNMEKIKLNHYYNLTLKIEVEKTGIFEHMSAVQFEEEGPFISFEGDSIHKIYSSPNVTGLHYSPTIKN